MRLGSQALLDERGSQQVWHGNSVVLALYEVNAGDSLEFTIGAPPAYCKQFLGIWISRALRYCGDVRGAHGRQRLVNGQINGLAEPLGAAIGHQKMDSA
jgi:hypothetical protein